MLFLLKNGGVIFSSEEKTKKQGIKDEDKCHFPPQKSLLEIMVPGCLT